MIEYPPTTMTPQRAEALASLLNSQDIEGWSYKARHDPQGSGRSLVDIYNKTGEHTGTL